MSARTAIRLPHLVVPFAAAALVLVLAGNGLAQDAVRASVKRLLQSEVVSGVDGKEAHLIDITWSPGATTGRHTHPGDEYAEVIEGELQLSNDGQPPRIVKAGEAYHNLAGVVHETKNISDRPARSIAILITDKGKPTTEPVK
jgi:quercetin dioxygenase-like cupin family protein